MKEKVFAEFIDKKNIKIIYNLDDGESYPHKIFTFIEDGFAQEVPTIKKENSNGKQIEYHLTLQKEIALGHDFALSDEKYNTFPIHILHLQNQDWFDQEYTYRGHDLGMHYTSQYVEFRLWSPFASHVLVIIIHEDQKQYYEMTRTAQGVFYLKLAGDYDCDMYLYEAMIEGEKRIAPDPYAVASAPNGVYSAIVSLEKTKIDYCFDCLPPFKRYTDAIIYETSIRDFTIYPGTDVVHKGKFLGAVEKGRRSINGAMVGLDHLKKLGITHIQLLPIFDFATVDEEDPTRLYNWGYDPMQYNVPEGSYATEVKNPYTRIIELKKMVQEFHKNGIRVVMDVVYNHMYDQKMSPFEILCPGYYFRKTADGKLSNGSFCGNDLASEKPMVRSFIVDSCLYWLNEYGIDGFRFDLMGILDIETMNIMAKRLKEIRPDIMLYGEGWNMPTALNDHDKAMMGNAQRLKDFGFFNDSYREIVKGKTNLNELDMPGYLLGQSDYIEGFKFAFMGSTINYCFPPLFSSLNQSVNYVECHDNNTLYDKISAACLQDSHEQRLRRVVLVNEVIVLSYGIPFIHMGQEVGLTKFHDHNSYRSGDRYNQFDYQKLSERRWMAKCVNDIIQVRKMYDFLRYDDPEELNGLFRFENLDNGGLLIDYIKASAIAPLTSFKIFINPSVRTIYYDLKEYYRVIFNEAGLLKDEMYSQSLMINGLTVVIVAK